MRFRHGLILLLMFAGAVALQFILTLPPLLETLLFILIIAIPVAFPMGVVRQLASPRLSGDAARAKRRKQWIRGAALFACGTLAVALTQPILGANSPDAIILAFGLGVVAVMASYLLLVPLAVEWIAGPRGA
jgi:hypothetical protein